MRLTGQELTYVRAKGAHITEKCDGCGKLLNQSFRFTIAGRPEMFCCAVCRDSAYFGNPEAAKRHAAPGRCAFCGGSLATKRRGTLYCGPQCRRRDAKPVNPAIPNNAYSGVVKSMTCGQQKRLLVG